MISEANQESRVDWVMISAAIGFLLSLIPIFLSFRAIDHREGIFLFPRDEAVIPAYIRSVSLRPVFSSANRHSLSACSDQSLLQHAAIIAKQ